MFFAPIIRTRAEAPALRSFDHGFERFIDEMFFKPAPPAGPRAQEDDKAWTVSLDLPGVAREDLNLEVEGKVLRITTRAQAARPYQAAWELPQEIDIDATRGKLENGVLTLTLAKAQPKTASRQIPLD